MLMYPKNYFKDLSMAAIALPIAGIIGFIALFITGAIPNNIYDHPEIIIGIVLVFIMLAVGIYSITIGKRKTNLYSQKANKEKVSQALVFQLIFAFAFTVITLLILHWDMLIVIIVGLPSGYVFSWIIKALGIH